MKTNCYTAILMAVTMALAGCNQAELKKKDLDRKTAAIVIGQYYEKNKIDHLAFSKEGFKLAQSRGIITRTDGGFPPYIHYKFTPAGISLFGSLVADSTRIISNAFVVDEDIYFKLETPLLGRIEITGISGIPMGGDSYKNVEYVIYYILPKGVSKDVFLYVFQGLDTNAMLQRFDDGWRVSKN